MRDWIVVSGNLINSVTADNNGFEFFGPYTRREAKLVRNSLRRDYGGHLDVCAAVQLIGADMPKHILAEKEEHV